MENVLQNIYIGSKSMDSIELKYKNIEVPLYNGEDQEFKIFIKNFGPPTTLSFDVDRSIEDYVILVEAKPYVKDRHYSRLVLRVPSDASPVAEGNFYIVSGYGSKKSFFNLRIGMSGVDANDYFKPKFHGDYVLEEKKSENIKYTPRGTFKIREDWRDARKNSEKEGRRWDRNIVPAVFAKKERKETNKTNENRKYPEKTRQIRTSMDIGGIIISLLFIAALILFYFYILKTDVANTLTKSQVIILSAIIIGFAIFVVIFILNFFKTTIEE